VTTTRALSYRQLLATPEVRALLLATLLMRLAGRMLLLAIVLYALTRTGSPVLAGWLAFAAVAPGLAISPIAGALIDRVGSVWAITVDMVASATCVVALMAVDRLGWASAPVLLSLVGLFSLTSPLTMAGIRALLPRLVPVAALDRANALDTAIHGVTDIGGPALAGAVMGFGGPTLALGLIAVIYAAAAFCLGTIRRPRGQLPRLGRCSSRRGAASCACCASRRYADWPSRIRCTRCRGAFSSLLFRCSPRDNSPAERDPPLPACSGQALASSAVSPR
jgi:hypothetical protein